jgi:PAS domain S-box-containing protein
VTDVDELLDGAPCGFLSFHDDGRIALINATLLQQLGYAREELLGRHVETVLAVGSRIFHQTHFFPLLKLHGRAQEVFLLLRTKAGDDLGALCNAVRRERGGTFVTDCVLMEVRERRKYEDALLQAKREAEQARAVVEARTRELEEANRRLEDQALEVELQHQRLSEQAAELEAQSEALHSLNDALTERSAELERQRAAADEANQAKSNFLAVMSHELRTPLNAIGGYVQLLEMGVHGPVTAPQREALSRIDRSQRHLLRLVNDVLNLTRIEAGRVDYTLERVPLADVVRSALPMIEPQIAAKGLRLSVSVPPELVVRADREKAQQILLNLLTNSVKFTDAGGQVTVDAVADAPAPAEVLLRVADTGIGIPAEMLSSIFEPFVQVDAGWTRTTEGSGLGLAISRDLARGMGGDLTAESAVGRGSTFTVVLQRWSDIAGDDPGLAAAARRGD